MAYVSCAAEIAANIVQSCATPNVGGYEGTAIAIPRGLNTLDITRDASNPRIIKSISIGTAEHVVAIDNVMETPFDGSSTTSNTDNGWGRFDKVLSVRVPLRGAAASKEVIEPLLRSRAGLLLIVPKKSQVGDGSFEVIGVEQGAKATEITRNENENGGDWTATLQTSEYYAEYTLFDTDYKTTKALYDALLAKAY